MSTEDTLMDDFESGDAGQSNSGNAGRSHSGNAGRGGGNAGRGGRGNAGRRNSGRTCFKCGDAGHIASHCPQNNNNTAQTQNRGGHNQGNTRGQANRGGNNQRNGRGGSANSHQSQQRGVRQNDLYCNNCPGYTNHSTADCTRNKKRKRTNDSNSQDSESWNQVPMAFVQGDYCPTCNSTMHTPSTCPANRRRKSVKIRCDKCALWGHTRDECQNPNKRRCSNCYIPGASTKECKCRQEGSHKVHLYFSRYHRKADPGFKWKLPTWDVTSGVRPPNKQDPNAIPSPIDTPMQTIMEVSANVAGPMTRQRLKSISTGAVETFRGGGLPAEIRDYVRSCRRYEFYNANKLFHSHEEELVRVGMLDHKTITEAKFAIGCGAQFLREPGAMEAISRRQRPRCRTCLGFGLFLDGKLRVVPSNANVLDVRNFDAWGVFVGFECFCSNNGFWYV